MLTPTETAPTIEREMTPGPRIVTEVYVYPETRIETYDYETGCHLRIGEYFESNVLLALGFNPQTRREACDRLIAVLTEAREWMPK